MQSPEQFYTRAKWKDWFEHSMLLALEDNLTKVQNAIGPIHKVLPRRQLTDSRHAGKMWKKARKEFQAKIHAALHRQSSPNIHARFDFKLQRWNLQDPDKPLHQHLSVRQRTPNWHARSSHQRLKELAHLVTPRVHAAVFGSIWNRWCTLRRFQSRGRCRLCQRPLTEDSIEHYACCTVVRDVAARKLRLDPILHVNIYSFTCTNPLILTEEVLSRIALLIYATYRALNYQRHAVLPLQGEDLQHAISQWLIEGTRGHPKSSHALASAWTNAEGKRLPAIY